MEALDKNQQALEPVITDFATSTTGIKFKKDILVGELLSLGNSRITPQIAELVGVEVEGEIHRRRIQFLSTELISEMVAAKLEELGLIRFKNAKKEKKPEKADGAGKEDSFSTELLEVLAPKEVVPNILLNTRPRKMPVSFSRESLEVLESECCIRDERGVVIETADQLLSRVARAISEADAKYNPMADITAGETGFYNLMASSEFVPDVSILRHAGRSMGQLLSNYVLPLRDTTESIFDTMKQAAIIHKRGGCAGFSFTHLRPGNDAVGLVPGRSSGPSAFMRAFQMVMETVFHGAWLADKGRGILNVDHPDIIDFIEAAGSSISGDGSSVECSSHFLPSVGITDHFMKMVTEGRSVMLVNPRSRLPDGSVPARKIFNKLVSNLLYSGRPGVLFLDRIEEANPAPKEGLLEAVTAPDCQPLLPFETCSAGSVNLSLFVDSGDIDWEKLGEVVFQAVHFLDNAIEINHYPLPEADSMTKKLRKMGLGVMGFGTALARLKIDYSSPDAVSLGEKVMSFIQRNALRASLELAGKRGVFPGYHESIFVNRGAKRRNAVLTAVTDTKISSCIAGCSEGIEPAFSGGMVLPEAHLRMQSAFQRHTENSVYKEIPFFPESTREDVAHALLLAHHLGLKMFNIKLARPKGGLMKGRNPDVGSYFCPDVT